MALHINRYHISEFREQENKRVRIIRAKINLGTHKHILLSNCITHYALGSKIV